MKLIFCGTPQFAVPALERLIAAGHEVKLVVTQPDRPAGRKGELLEPAVKRAALAAGLPVVQPERIKKNSDFAARLERIHPDAVLVVAYGRIIPKWMLDLAPMGNINLHASLLPKYRGAAPIQWAIARGEEVSGVTTMRLDEGLDTGPILLQREVAILPDQTAADLAPILAETGAELMLETLARIDPASSNPIQPEPQDSEAATLAPILAREDALVNFNRPARAIYNRWRGFQPWPGAYTSFQGRKLILSRLKPAEPAFPGDGLRTATPGELAAVGGRLFAAAGEKSWIELLELQWEGRKRMAAPEFLRGAHIPQGARLGAD